MSCFFLSGNALEILLLLLLTRVWIRLRGHSSQEDGVNVTVHEKGLGYIRQKDEHFVQLLLARIGFCLFYEVI